MKYQYAIWTFTFIFCFSHFSGIEADIQMSNLEEQIQVYPCASIDCQASISDLPSLDSDIISHNASYLSLAGIAGESVGHDTRRASVSFFFVSPTPMKALQPFLDVRGHYLEHDHWAANAGFGCRWWDCGGNRVWGTNLYYDFRDDETGNFNQVGIGFESLGTCWDIRLNGYFPVGTKRHAASPVVFDNFIGDFIMVCRHFGAAETGADFEVGMPLYQCNCFRFYGGLGTYYYHCKHFHNFWGGSAHLKIGFTEYLTIDVHATFDKVFHSEVQGIFSLNIPFDIFSSTCHNLRDCCSCLLTQPVERRDIIVLDRTCCWKKNFNDCKN